MHDQRSDAGTLNCVGKCKQRFIRILLVDSYSAFHRYGNLYRILHGRNALANQRRLGHQTGAEAALLHAIRWAADIEIDLVVAKVFADARRLRESLRIGTAKLERHRVLERVKTEQPLAIAMQHRTGGEHLGIDQRPTRQQPMEEAAMPVRPFHHRGDTKAPIQRFLRFRCFCSHFVTFIHNSCRTTWAHFGLFYRPPWLAPSRRPRARRWTTAVSSPIPTA